MAPARWRFDRFVPVEPERVYAWLVDFREDDHRRPAYRRAVDATEAQAARTRREVLAREGNVVRLRDTWNGRTIEQTVRLDPARRAIEMESAWGHRARWHVADNPGGARVVVEGELAPRGLAGLLLPFARRRIEREMARDFHGHMADLVNELNPEGVPVGGGF